jgi:hypothetical protein
MVNPPPVTAAVRSVPVSSRYCTVKPPPPAVPVMIRSSTSRASFSNRTEYAAVEPLTTPSALLCSATGFSYRSSVR